MQIFRPHGVNVPVFLKWACWAYWTTVCLFRRGSSLCGHGPQFPFRDLNDLTHKAFTVLRCRSSPVSHHMTDDGHTLEAFRKQQIAGPEENLLDLVSGFACRWSQVLLVCWDFGRQGFGIPFILQQTPWPQKSWTHFDSKWLDGHEQSQDRFVKLRQSAILSLHGWNGLCL